jgi:hypothetical protein
MLRYQLCDPLWGRPDLVRPLQEASASPRLHDFMAAQRQGNTRLTKAGLVRTTWRRSRTPLASHKVGAVPRLRQQPWRANTRQRGGFKCYFTKFRVIVLLRPALQLARPRNAGVWAPSFGRGKSPVGRVIDIAPCAQVGKTGCSGCLARRSRAPALAAWTNVRNVRRCNVRPQVVSNSDCSCFDSFPRPATLFFLSFFFFFFPLFLGWLSRVTFLCKRTLIDLSPLDSLAEPLGMNPAAALRL